MPRRNLNSQNGVRDGSWWVDPQVVEKYRALGIDALNDPAHADDDVARDIEANRVEYAQGLNRSARMKKKAHADAMWTQQLADLGLDSNWHTARNEMLRNARAKGLGDDQLDWLWNAGPLAWKEAGLIGAATPVTPTTPAPPTTPEPELPPPPVLPPPTPITPTNIPSRTPPAPSPATNRTPPQSTNRTPINGNFAQLGVQPSVLSLNPTQPSANYTNKPRRPPVGGMQTGYMQQPKRTTAQLGF